MIAADHLEPYAVRVRFRGRFRDPADFTGTLLTRVAQGCDRAGASLIGHIKCFGSTEVESLRGNLTSLRSGAHCSPPQAQPAESIDLDLAVLVYGLGKGVVADLVAAAADAVSEELGATWDAASGDDRVASTHDHVASTHDHVASTHDHVASTHDHVGPALDHACPAHGHARPAHDHARPAHDHVSSADGDHA